MVSNDCELKSAGGGGGNGGAHGRSLGDQLLRASRFYRMRHGHPWASGSRWRGMRWMGSHSIWIRLYGATEDLVS